MKTLLLILSTLFLIKISIADESWKLYDDSQVATVSITIDSLDLNWIYNNIYSDSLHLASVHFQNSWIDTTIDSVGFRLRGNTSRDAEKKSFKLSFNDFVAGRKFYGIEKMNLNGEHNDPSIVRSKLCWGFFQEIGVSASRANHVALYINGSYYGLYISIEHIDDEFLKKNFKDSSGNLWKCLWPADLEYINSNPNSYKFMQGNRRTYDLQTNKSADDYTDLARLIKNLKNTSNSALEDSLENIFDVPSVLKYFAMNVLTASWDDYWYLKNNYYLYHEPSTDLITIIPYDYDNTFGIDWFGINWASRNPYLFGNTSEPRPLATRLLGNAKYKNLYTHFLEFYKNNVFDFQIWEQKLINFKALLTPFAMSDNYRTLDYGFDANDFLNSYDLAGYSNQHAKKSIKDFTNLRNSFLANQLTWDFALPLAYRIDWFPKVPLPSDSITVEVSAFSHLGITSVEVEVFPEIPSPAPITFALNFSPISQTKRVEEADLWIGKIPPFVINGKATFKINVTDSSGNSVSYPKSKILKISTPEVDTTSLKINELMADNQTTITDSNGEFDDWIELYNPTSQIVLLTGMYLSDSENDLLKWQFTEPNLFLNSGEFLIVWCDNDLGQNGVHTSFKLSKNGEKIILTESDGVTIIDSINFGNQSPDVSFGRIPDASEKLDFLNPTPNDFNAPFSSVIEQKLIPQNFYLSAFPNPFNPSSTINYEIKTTDYNLANLKIYNVLGQKVKEFEIKSSKGSMVWNGTDDFRKKVSSGVYFVRLQAGNFSKTTKVLLLK